MFLAMFTLSSSLLAAHSVPGNESSSTRLVVRQLQFSGLLLSWTMNPCSYSLHLPATSLASSPHIRRRIAPLESWPTENGSGVLKHRGEPDCDGNYGQGVRVAACASGGTSVVVVLPLGGRGRSRSARCVDVKKKKRAADL